MGYDLHITRRKDWSGPGREIAAKEWLAYVEKDPELSIAKENGPYFAKWVGNSSFADAWLDWSEGNVYTKNPDEALIEKMVSIARALDARVQGDDGEVYRSGYEPPERPRAQVRNHLRNWLRSLKPVGRMRQIEPPFKVGDRVVDAFHKEATVIEMDAKSNHGLGKVKVRYDDGREVSLMLAASGLSPRPNASR